MASNTRRNWQMPLERTDTGVSLEQEREHFEGMRVSWGGIWAGVLVALGTLLLLSTLGLAVGIAAGNAAAGAGTGVGTPGVGTVNTTMGTAAVIWAGLSLLISLFLGGLVSTRMGRIWDRGAGMFHGALVWVITLAAILYLSLRGLGMMGGSIGVVGGGAAATHPEAAIGWSPFIIEAISLLAALAGAAAGLRRLTGEGTNRSDYNRDTKY